MIHWKILLTQWREKYFRPVIALCGTLMLSIHCAPTQYWEEKCSYVWWELSGAWGLSWVRQEQEERAADWQHTAQTAVGACAPSVVVGNMQGMIIYIPWQRRKKKALDWQSDKFSAFLYWRFPEIQDPLKTESLCFSPCLFICHTPGWVHSSFVFHWNLETSTVARTPYAKLCTNRHPREHLQTKNDTDQEKVWVHTVRHTRIMS